MSMPPINMTNSELLAHVENSNKSTLVEHELARRFAKVLGQLKECESQLERCEQSLGCVTD